MRTSVAWLSAALVLVSVGLFAAEPASAPADKIDSSKDGNYASGRWEYQYKISGAGSRSEGYYGKLLADGKELPPPAGINDYYQTPWGKLFWVGEPVVAFGGHGWMPTRLPSKPEGKALDAPVTAAAAGNAVLAMVVTPGKEPAKDAPAMDGWVADEIKKLGVKNPRVEKTWFRLTDQPATIYDTKMHGWLTVSLGAPAADGSLTVVFGGSRKSSESLPAKEGATKLVHRTLESVVADPLEFYIALKVGPASGAVSAPTSAPAGTAGR